jgi:tetratricopeptide (TPR) repeat protein
VKIEVLFLRAARVALLGVAVSLLLAAYGPRLKPALASGERQYRVGEKALRSGDYQKAAKFFTDLIGSDERDVNAHLGAAFAYFKLQNYSSCYDHAREALKIDENNARAHALAGLALLRSGFLSTAVPEFIQAIRLNPKEALAFGGLAEIDYYENRAKESRLKSSYASTLDQNEPDFLVTFARASSRLELFEDAADAYERFLQIAPKTDKEKRERIQGLIRFYRQLAGIRLHQITGPKTSSVPFRLGADRRPYIKLRVNGREATFVLDTGSGFTVISNEAAKRLGVSAVARGGTSQGVGGSGKFQIIYGLIKTIGLADLKIDSVPCFIRPFHSLQERAAQDRADGFIGLSVLSNFVTEIDYREQKLGLYRNLDDNRPGAPPSPDVVLVPFRTTQNGLISVETQLDDKHSINAILDSGASSTVVSSEAVHRLRMADSIIKGQTVQVVGAAGITDGVELLFLHNCQVAGLQQNNVRALVMDFAAINETSGFEQSGILGGDFLHHFRVTIDFARSLVAFQPQSSEVIRRLDPTKPDNEHNQPE